VKAVLSIIATLLFAVDTIVCSVLSVPLSLMDPSGRLYMVIGRFWARSFLWLYAIRVTVRGLENIRPGQNYVYLANHSSYVDIPVVMACIPDQIRIILKKSLTKIPIWGWALTVGPFITIDRSNASAAAESLKVAIEKIQRGASILLFPEGTRTHDGALQPFKRGAFRLAYDSKTPMLPLAIEGTYDILPRHGNPLPRFGSRVTLSIGHAIDPSAFTEPNARAQEIAMMKFAEDRLRTMLGHSPTHE
jgi:1-acyl-sn-glycerol-3-phosphate acyltransferase